MRLTPPLLANLLMAPLVTTVLPALGPGMTFLAPALCAIFPTFPLPAINLIIKFISQRLAENTQKSISMHYDAIQNKILSPSLTYFMEDLKTIPF